VINKIVDSFDEAVADVFDGSTILFGGFGGAGVPYGLISALVRQGSKNIIAVSNNPGYFEEGIAELIKHDRIAKVIGSFPISKDSYVFMEKYKEGKIDFELVPQGTLAERIRAGGAGIEAFYTPTGAGTEIADGLWRWQARLPLPKWMKLWNLGNWIRNPI
jgi:3-oxoadipate CoA-transferase alpha subunit